MSPGLILLGLFVGVIVLLVLITFHEFAHFITAKLCKVYVYEFSIGMGPAIFKWGKKETTYCIRLIPLGGYVSIASELVDPPDHVLEKDIVVPKERKMENISRWKRLVIIVAGALMNLFIAIFLLTTLYTASGVKKGDVYTIGSKYGKESVLRKAGLTKQDQVIIEYEYAKTEELLTTPPNVSNNNEYYKKILGNSNDLPIYKTISADLAGFIKKTKFKVNNKDVHGWLKIKYWDRTISKIEELKPIDLENSPEYKKEYTLGLVPPTKFFESSAQAYGAGWADSFKNSVQILKSLGSIFTPEGWKQLSGPLGTITETTKSIKEGSFYYFITFVAMISANLFVFNLLPFPPLDGYRFFENLIEMVTRKKIPDKAKLAISIVGALFLLILFLLVTIKDLFLKDLFLKDLFLKDLFLKDLFLKDLFL